MLFSLYSKYLLFETDKFYLEQDDTNPHTPKNTFNYINSVDELELIPHPTYSPDLVPSDYYLFRSFVHFLKGNTFNNLEQVQDIVNNFFDSKSPEWVSKGIFELTEKWVKTIEHDGSYFDIYSFFLFF